MCETPSVLYALAGSLGTRAVAFEWSHEEMEEPLQDFLHGGGSHFERLWSLPGSAEFFCGDGRIAAGHFALLQRLRDEGCLDRSSPTIGSTPSHHRTIGGHEIGRWPSDC